MGLVLTYTHTTVSCPAAAADKIRESSSSMMKSDARKSGVTRRTAILAREIAALARLLSRRADPAALGTLNARVADLYQLSVAEFEHILNTFPLVAATDRDEALGRLRLVT